MDDVSVIRVILIILLVLYHSFAIFNGAWDAPDGYCQIPAYWWIASASYSFMLEMFVFISGYLFGYQVRTKGETIISFKNTILKKAKRLLLPCFFFGIIYYLIFYDLKAPVFDIVYTIVNGAGHLWFLPMLFWCFVAIFVIEKLKIKPFIVFPLLVVCSLISFLPLPFRMTSAMYYLLFFYTGYILKKKDIDLSRFFEGKYAVFSIFAYIILFVSFTLIREQIANSAWGGEDSGLLYKVLKMSAQKASVLIYSWSGVIMTYITVNWLLIKNKIKISQSLMKVSALCFGVYIYQQFILKLLYYDFGFMESVSPYILPWMGFVVAIILSVSFSYLTVKTKFGRFLIG